MSWDSFVDAVQDGVDAVVDEASDLKDDVVDAAEDLLGDGQDTLNEVTDTVQAAFDEHNVIAAVVAVVGGLIALAVGIAGDTAAFGARLVGAVVGTVVAMAGAILGMIARIVVGVFTGGADSKPARAIGAYFTEGGRELGEQIEAAAGIVGQLIQRANDIVADIVLSFIDIVRCWVHGAVPVGQSGAQGFQAIDHFVVLMLENRSFDHMLGHLELPKVEGLSTGNYSNLASDGVRCPAGSIAPFMLEVDVPHEFPDVHEQLHGVPSVQNGGFVLRYERELAAVNRLDVDRTIPMRAFNSATLPVMHTLAQQFAVCDHWFSSLPGPTLPNRQFVHAATSGGMADSPAGAALGGALIAGGFDYENGTVYDRLDSKCIPWKIYAGDHTPLVMTLKGIASDNVVNGWTQIKPLTDLAGDMATQAVDFPNYVFIEPDYGHFWSDFKGGNSEHPLDSITGGETLVKSVYEALRASPIWNRSALIVLYDEHGGFYDHCVPPAAEPPGDERRYASWSASDSAKAFKFNRLGVRVPALVISPWVDAGVVDSNQYDHSSVIATITKRFGLRSLTRRDTAAKTLEHLFTRNMPRNDAPMTLPMPVGPLS